MDTCLQAFYRLTEPEIYESLMLKRYGENILIVTGFPFTCIFNFLFLESSQYYYIGKWVEDEQ